MNEVPEHIHHNLRTYQTRAEAMDRIDAEPKAYRSRMVALPSGYYGGAFILEWHGTMHRRVLCADGRWHYIWSEACVPACK